MVAQYIVCYRCGKAGHIAKKCRVKLSGWSSQQPSFNWVQPQQQNPQYIQSTYTNMNALQQYQPMQYQPALSFMDIYG